MALAASTAADTLGGNRSVGLVFLALAADADRSDSVTPLVVTGVMILPDAAATAARAPIASDMPRARAVDGSMIS